MLVEALTEDEGQRLAGWVGSPGQELSAVFDTHGHVGQVFGAGPAPAAIPRAQLIASTGCPPAVS